VLTHRWERRDTNGETFNVKLRGLSIVGDKQKQLREERSN